MKKLNKKGFTIVELSIVIAVVAILSAVLIPTFSGIVNKAKISAAEQEAQIAYREVIAVSEEASIDVEEVEIDAYIITSNGYFFDVKAGVISEATKINKDGSNKPAKCYANVAAIKAANEAVDTAVYLASEENSSIYLYHVVTATDIA